MSIDFKVNRKVLVNLGQLQTMLNADKTQALFC